MKDLVLDTKAGNVTVLIDRHGNVEVYGAKSLFGGSATLVADKVTPIHNRGSTVVDISPFRANETH